MLSLVGVFYPYNRGSLYTALVVIYALTSGIAGYTASSFYKQLEGTNWVSLLCPDRGGIVVWKDTEGLH
jgi:transmembrane 9 superfamily protein 1